MIDSIVSRAHYLATQMIFLANHRENKTKGDPKVGGHPAACSSALHIMGAIHLFAKSGFDYIVNKPHASPVDHSYNYLLRCFFHEDLKRFSDKESNEVMHQLRAFPSSHNQPVFQSYHSAYDPDHHGFLPSGTVGIPPVNAGYLALAYRYAKEHGYNVPAAHFWCVMGDSEFREGSLFEAIPEFAERELGNLTWILDYNRQSLDGHRMGNKEIMGGNDDRRVEKTMEANGWKVIQIRHGSLRQKLFKKKGGGDFKKFFEEVLQDYELQALLMVKDVSALRKGIVNLHSPLKAFLSSIEDKELYQSLRDFGGHDIMAIFKALQESKKNPKTPTMVICHTLKGWGLEDAAMPGNHSSLPTQEEVDLLRKEQGLSKDKLFAHFKKGTPEDEFLQQRATQLFSEMDEEKKIRQSNEQFFRERVKELGEVPSSLDINLKMASYPHTQWMLGQLTAKLTRIANTPLDDSAEVERAWKAPSEIMVFMAPDVGTSTNLNPVMDGKIFGAQISQDYEKQLGVKDRKTPDLVQQEDGAHRFIRFEIAEANTMSCAGSFGKMREILGIPLLPLMTIYDFFIKRSLDQYFYNMYWQSSFIVVGTPSGVTLSPEGAQHGWKSDIQVPNQITWEPAFCIELDWILSDAIKRHLGFDNQGRSGVVIRGVTRGVDQKDMLKYLSQQVRFKAENSEAVNEAQIMNEIKQDVLKGAYYLINYKGSVNYEPGDNVVNVFVMGSLITEGIKASEELLKKGIYANVIVVTSPDLLLGNLGHQNHYNHLKEGLGINGDIYVETQTPLIAGELPSIAGRRIPVVSVHDGEPGLLDNIGSILGVKQEALAVRKHSRCGRPDEIYQYHNINDEAIIVAVEKALLETSLENVQFRN